MDEARLLFLKHKQPPRELWLQQQKKGMQEQVVEPELPQEGGARERTPRARSICVRGSCANAPRSIFWLSSLFRLSTFQSGRLKHVESVPGHCQIESFRKMGMAPLTAQSGADLLFLVFRTGTHARRRIIRLSHKGWDGDKKLDRGGIRAGKALLGEDSSVEAAVLRAPLSSHGAVAVQALALGLEWSSKAKCHISEFERSSSTKKVQSEATRLRLGRRGAKVLVVSDIGSERSCYGEQRTKYNLFLYLSGSRFSLFLFLTLPRVVPNVWHFPYFVGATSTNSLMIKLQPKIYDHIMLTVRISFILSVCSQVPVIVIRLPELRGLSVETFTNNRRFLMVFPLFTAALSTPPDIWCQIVAPFLISLILELAIFVASIVQVRSEGWTSGMRLRKELTARSRKKKRGTPRTWQSHYQFIPEQLSTKICSSVKMIRERGLLLTA
ncbi:transport membrane protein [Cucumis melo var. makuwa]|uniref:Transport membrane protein (Mitochondrion) n=1 Tax=Cucumis melo var. makuwa TaxID=1194695 RepID=A0A5A7V1T2_CUCMM|nr:transport membrane protein [Cucumis melo var. makuwa]